MRRLCTTPGKVTLVDDRRSLLELFGFVVWFKVVAVCIREDLPHAVLAIVSAIVATSIFALTIERDVRIGGIPTAIARSRHRV